MFRFGATLTSVQLSPGLRLYAPTRLSQLIFRRLPLDGEQLSHFAIENRLPFISEGRHWAEVGALLTYGPSGSALFKRAAYYVDKILRGVKPADLPIEQPTTFELVINLRTARALGITIPESILVRADEVIR
jgi:putative tryptophan/tyrosine transport system substrate-binding protein